MPRRGSGLPRLRHLIERAYDSAFEPRPFASLLPDVATALGADTAHVNIWVPALGGELAVNHEMPDHLIRLYREHHWRTDLWRHALERERIPVGRAFAGHAIVPFEKLLKSEMYNDALRPYGLFDICAGRLFTADAAGAAVSFMRARGRRFYNQQEVDRLGAVLPHMARAFSIRMRLDELLRQRDAFAVYFDRHSSGALLIDGKGRVAHVTGAARDFLLASDAPLRIERGQLRASDPAADRRLQKLLAGGDAAAWLFDRAVVALSPAHRLTITPTSFAGNLVPREAAFLVVIESGAGDAHRSVDTAAARFGLTRAETGLLAELVAGRSLREAGERLGRARTTVRNQLQSIFDKTGARRQAELVAKILHRRS